MADVWFGCKTQVPATDRWGYTAIAVRSSIYMICGCDGSGHMSVGITRYDTETGEWYELAAIQAQRRRVELNSAYVDGFIYVMGGTVGNISSNLVDRYNMLTNECHDLPVMIQARAQAGCCVSEKSM
jgi:hypothetical protein